MHKLFKLWLEAFTHSYPNQHLTFLLIFCSSVVLYKVQVYVWVFQFQHITLYAFVRKRILSVHNYERLFIILKVVEDRSTPKKIEQKIRTVWFTYILILKSFPHLHMHWKYRNFWIGLCATETAGCFTIFATRNFYRKANI